MQHVKRQHVRREQAAKRGARLVGVKSNAGAGEGSMHR